MACLGRDVYTVDFTVDGTLDGECGSGDGGGGTANEGSLPQTGPDKITIGDNKYTVQKDNNGNYVTEVEPVTGITMLLLEPLGNEFDGLTTVENSLKADSSRGYFMGYAGVWGQTFMSAIYQNNQGAYGLSPYFEGFNNVVAKFHDDDIMKNSVFSGAPAMYTHLAIAFLNPAMQYIKGTYNLANTGLSYTNLPATAADGRFGLLNLKEQIRVANRRGQKVVLAMGGATYHEWADVASEGNNGQVGHHIRALADLLLDLNADGIDVDYERHLQYGSDPIGTTNELRGAIRALRMAVDLANQEDDDKKDRILTIAGWSTGADSSWNTVSNGIPGDDIVDLAGYYTQADKDAAKAEWDYAKNAGLTYAEVEAFRLAYERIVVGHIRMSKWTGGAGMHRHAFADKSVAALIDILSIMAYDASYKIYDPIQAWQQYRRLMPDSIPVLMGFQRAPEGWNDGQMLVRKNTDAGPVGTVFLKDGYGNTLTDAYYSVERLISFVDTNRVNPHDGAMIWTMNSLIAPGGDPPHPSLTIGPMDIALEVVERLGLPRDERSHKTWTVWEE